MQRYAELRQSTTNGPEAEKITRVLQHTEGLAMASYLHITSVPPGEAPLWVRERWVGLLLPLAQNEATPATLLTAGVLSGPRGLLSCLKALLTGKLERQSGFVVEARSAIAVLEISHPEASAWWRTHTPHLLRRKQYLVFQKDTGNIVEKE